MKAKKYIFVINKDGSQEFRCGYVELHAYILNQDERYKVRVNGGGFFDIDFENKEIVFYGKSSDFGRVHDQQKVCKKYYDQIMDSLLEFIWIYYDKEYPKDYFKLYIRDELGDKHLITK